jgi:hypothetical protein
MKRLTYTLLALIFLHLTACKDYFELDRPPQNPWTTLEELEHTLGEPHGG